MKRLLVVIAFLAVAVIAAWLITGCSAAGFRFKAGVDVSVTKVVQDSTRTTSVTRSSSEPSK